MSLITSAHHPPLAVSPQTTVLDACRQMKERGVGAVAVVGPDERPQGIFTERDVVHKIVTEQRDPSATLLSEVMTRPCLTIASDLAPEDALAVMVNRQVHHLALVDEDRKLIGMVSYRTLMRERVDILNAEVDHLSAYMGDDGIGGG